ncbi:hypothetical protein SEA_IDENTITYCRISIS_43 [Mycobacterium phage IdentityCrisis]|uniref:Uncharacterized protein n=1 Tax=Mycobacterium phage IdentityCrisis TaxID=2599866 RepID=A0A5J6TMW8_9CAUD|nr:hypothetical protein QEH37_gp42 [Mycobacterium phage IdentityCrisis]QFG10062.1 hypothetical protein SEA_IDENTITYCRISIS_43 [Mycobacterium phage IdentityCrisis]
MGWLASQEISTHNHSLQRTQGGGEVIRALCVLIAAVASGSAGAALIVGTATTFGVALAVAVAAGLGADLAGHR